MKPVYWFFCFLFCFIELHIQIKWNCKSKLEELRWYFTESSGFLYFKPGQLKEENWLELPSIVNEPHSSFAKNGKHKRSIYFNCSSEMLQIDWFYFRRMWQTVGTTLLLWQVIGNSNNTCLEKFITAESKYS